MPFSSTFDLNGDTDGVSRCALLLLFALTLSACGFNQTTVEGWPDVDLGATEVIEYKATNQRPLHLHVFAPANSEPTGAVLFLHGLSLIHI